VFVGGYQQPDIRQCVPAAEWGSGLEGMYVQVTAVVEAGIQATAAGQAGSLSPASPGDPLYT